MDDIKETLRAMIAEILELKPEQIGDDAEFVKDLGMDSMRALELLAYTEKKFRITIPEDQLPNFRTLNETLKIVEPIVGNKKA
ncbi:MAG: acyl carrier protein [Candidatus Omnitrophica bacterium]|nr:acyl carrier protein [Candidatus Omnitrophota bacterium]